ncbi:MAG: LamG domain-containing protein, partial [Gallionellaceae bacterium]|nr:LamG domain-containing protein [Gallionellaceae bacterium]
AEYRMDEASWNGTAGEVVDSSGSGNHAQAFNSASTAGTTPAIATNPGTCRYGVFDNGGTITQGYVQTPLPDLTTDFTFAAWIRTTNNAATGQRILIDDQNNTGGYGLSLGDGAAGILRFYSRGITPVILDSTYTIANNTWYFVAAVADITNKKRTLYVFDTAGALLNSTTEAAWTGGAWGTDAGPVSIGGEVNGPPQTESPATFHFRGNLDEVRVYQKVLSQTALAAIAAQTHACPIVTADHFAISHSGTGVTCQAEPITITAHDALHNIFTAQAASIMLSTSTGKGDWSLIAGGGTLTPGAVNSGSAVYAFAAGDNGQVTLGLKHTAAGSVSLGVTDGTATLTTGTGAGEADPPVVYSDAGFSVTDNAGNPVNIGNQVAGQTSGTLYLQAVKTAPNGACTGVFNTTVNIEMAAQCNNPVACAGKQVTVNATALNVGITNATVVPPSGVAGVNVPLAFGANSIAPFTLNYPDVGRIKLYARYNMPLRDGTPSGNYMVGNSNPFVVKPGGFALSGIKRTSDSFANPAAVNAAGAKFVKAGEQFTATVTATTIDGVTATPNFGQETNPEPAESVKLTPTLAAGLGLTNNPAINGTFGAFANGIATGAAFTWNEVGIITLTPSVLSANYLGAGDATGAVSGTVGRFYAAMFGLTAGSITNRADVACPTCTWTYMGEQMNAAFTLTAKAADGATTLQNYNYSATSANNFAKLDPTAAGNPLLFGAVNSTATPTYLTARLDTSLPATGNFVNGNGTANVVAPLAITRSASADGPYALLDIGIAPQDSDGALMAAYNLDTDAVAGNDHTTVARSEVRYGRMKVSNAHGSELLTLPIGVTVQYWDGTNYVTSATDSLTTFASTNVVFANWQKNLTAGSTTASPASVVFANGVGSFNLSAPGAGKNGSVDLTTNAPSYLPSNTARATFGVYKGNNNFIYLRESY